MQTRPNSIAAVTATVSDFSFHNPQHAGLVALTMQQRALYMTNSGEVVGGFEDHVHDFFRDLNLNTGSRVDYRIDDGVDFVAGPYTTPEGSATVTPKTMAVKSVVMSYGDNANMRTIAGSKEISREQLIATLVAFRKTTEDAGYANTYRGSGNGQQLSDDPNAGELSMAYVAQQLRLFFVGLPSTAKFKVAIAMTNNLRLNYPANVLVMMVEIYNKNVATENPLVGVAFCSGLPIHPWAEQGSLTEEDISAIIDVGQKESVAPADSLA